LGGGAVPVVAGVVSVLTGSGAVAGAGAAGVVSEGLDWVFDGAAAVGVGSSFLDFFLKRPLKAFFIWSMASKGTPGMMIAG
jgi:hypothetical protein